MEHNPMTKQFGPTYPGHYPEEMRTQMWPLCCGARIISGFKNIYGMSKAEIKAEIEATLDAIPDHQIFSGETFKPHMTFLTLNSGQMESKTLMDVVAECGFVKIGEGKPRGSTQGWFLRDTSNTWKAA